jgi:integrase
MRKTAIKLGKVKVGNGQRLWCVTWPKIGKGRNRQFFKDKTEAETVLQQKLVEQENQGRSGLSFNERQRSEYLECAEKLQHVSVCQDKDCKTCADYLKPAGNVLGATIRDAVNFYLPHLHATKRTCTATELVDELLEVKEADGASERYRSDLRSRLTQFSDSFDGKPVSEITSTQIDEWLRSRSGKETGKRLAPVTRNNFRRVLIVAFNFARERGYCIGNPAEKTARAKIVEGTIGILNVDQTARLLESASAELVPYIAIGAFAGLRRAELERLDWREVDLQGGLIEVTAKKAKSARRRFVRIQPNLAKWLHPYAQLSGNVAPPKYRELLDAAREAAGIERWPHNALRHSFASYHLARFNDAAALALELGHTNSNLVFQHYRQLVKPKQAEWYWKITPAPTGKKVVAFAAASA